MIQTLDLQSLIIGASQVDHGDLLPWLILIDALQESRQWTWETVHELVIHYPEHDGPREMAARWLDENAGWMACGKCNGEGELSEKNYHGAWDTWKCGVCDGSGRVPNRSRERAEFVRVQVELVRFGLGDGRVYRPDVPGERYNALQRRERELLAFDWCPVAFPRTSRQIRTETPAIELLDGDGFRAAFAFGRGFVESVTMRAADWLRVADVLYWREGLTDVCEDCRQESAMRGKTIRPFGGCPRCSGTGTVPRPCPPTAQPIREVTITGELTRDLLEQVPSSGLVEHYQLKGYKESTQAVSTCEHVWNLRQDTLDLMWEVICQYLFRQQWPNIKFQFRSNVVY